MSKKNNGFTLVELIVVIVILAILVGVTIGGIYMYVGKAKINTDRQNCVSMENALNTYAATINITTSNNNPCVQIIKIPSRLIEYTSTDDITYTRNVSCLYGPILSISELDYITKQLFPTGFPKNETGGDWYIIAYTVYDDTTDNIIFDSSKAKHIQIKVFDSDSIESNELLASWKSACETNGYTKSNIGVYSNDKCNITFYPPTESVNFKHGCATN